MKKLAHLCSWCLLLAGMWACAAQSSAQKVNNQSSFDVQKLTTKATNQELNDSKEFLLVKEIPTLTDAYFSYWVINLTTQKLVTNGTITKGDITWHSRYTLKLTKLPEQMPVGKTQKDYENFIDIVNNK